MPRPKKVVPAPIVPASSFTGVVRTMLCVTNNGWPNFRILTLTLENGVVVKEARSDPYASFEAMQKLEFANDICQIRLNSNWREGRGWYLKTDKEGNDIQDGESS